ncbi:hypothetical protein CHRYSEO8AT_270044 [Chryseobacterium sp. 8AT]|nr:hypothetical protein CHRYSEO8AT_270044 [Chryseobacterium sp. 8AT]
MANHNLKNQKTSTKGKNKEQIPTSIKAKTNDFFVPNLLIKLTAKRENIAIGKSLNDSKKPSLSYVIFCSDNCKITIPIQFKTIEKTRKVSFSGSEIFGCLVVILGIYIS